MSICQNCQNKCEKCGEEIKNTPPSSPKAVCCPCWLYGRSTKSCSCHCHQATYKTETTTYSGDNLKS